jgi:hypothetical protein
LRDPQDDIATAIIAALSCGTQHLGKTTAPPRERPRQPDNDLLRVTTAITQPQPG